MTGRHQYLQVSGNCCSDHGDGDDEILSDTGVVLAVRYGDFKAALKSE